MSLIAAESAVLSIDLAMLSPEACLVREGVALSATQRYRYQHWLAEQLQTMHDECACRSCTAEGEADCEARIASLEADDARDAAREAWLASDDARWYQISDDQATWRLFSTPDEVESDAEASLRESEWGEVEKTMLLVAYVREIDPVADEETGDMIRVSVEIEPEEPPCNDGEEHDWCEPHSVVGGLRENPGVWGRGAGIVTRRVCAHCGAYEVCESAAQDPGTGSYYPSTSYEEADDGSLAWVARRRRAARVEDLVASLEADCADEDALRAAVEAALDEDEDATADDVRARLVEAQEVES